MNAFETKIDIFRNYEKSTRSDLNVILFLTRVFRFLFSKTGIFVILALLIYSVALFIYGKYQNPVFLQAAPLGHVVGFLWIIKTSPEFEKHHQEFGYQIQALKELLAVQ